MTSIRAALLALAVLGAIGLGGCTAEPATPASTTPATTASPSATSAPSTPAPTAAAYAPPAGDAPGQVALAVVDNTVDVPETTSIAGPGAVAADRPLSVEAACEGGTLAYEIRTTNPDDAGRTLFGGRVACDEPPVTVDSAASPYAGTVQVVVTDADDVQRGWVRVTQP